MAKIKGNSIIKDVRGMIGRQVVIKERLGTAYISAAPAYNENRLVSEKEQQNRDRFARTTAFAKAAMKDPALKALYASLTKKKGHTPYLTAKSDASHPPEITSIITHGYSGHVGSVIIVQATDNVKVMRVLVIIRNSLAEVVEQGEALDHGDGFNWMYTANTYNEDISGSRVEVICYDLAGNETRRSGEISGR